MTNKTPNSKKRSTKRGFRWGRTASPYAHLEEDDTKGSTSTPNSNKEDVSMTSVDISTPVLRPVSISVATSANSTPELECSPIGERDHYDNIIVSNINNEAAYPYNIEYRPEKKQAEDAAAANTATTDSTAATPTTPNTSTDDDNQSDTQSDVFSVTKSVAMEVLRTASNMTDTVAKTLDPRTFASPEGIEDCPVDTDKRDDSGESIVAKEIHDSVESACRCGNDFVVRSKESFDSVIEETHKSVYNFFDSSASLGEDFMSSTEESSQSAFSEKLPLSPLLEDTSEKLESTYENVSKEFNEFVQDHWALLRNHLQGTKVASE